MLTTEQIKKLEEMGFKKIPNASGLPNYMKRYRIHGIVFVFYGDEIMVTQSNVETCKEAQRDLAAIKAMGIGESK